MSSDERLFRTLEARLAIEAIVLAYAEAVDGADLETLGLLLRDCTVNLPSGVVLDDGDAVRQHYAETIIFYDDDEQAVDYRRRACSPRTRHVTTNLSYQFDDDVSEASTQCYVTVLQTLGGITQIIAAGRYLDRFSRGSDGWQIVERQLLLDNFRDQGRHAKSRRPAGASG